jgi:hypothetical protein
LFQRFNILMEISIMSTTPGSRSRPEGVRA